MKLEKLSYNKIRATLSPSDLSHRKVDIDNMLSSEQNMRKLVNEILDLANDVLGYGIFGPIVLGFIPQDTGGLEIEVTVIEGNQGCTCGECMLEDDDEDDSEDFVNDPFSNDEDFKEVGETLLYKFRDIEYVITIAHRLNNLGVTESRLYHYQNYYYLALDNLNIEENFMDDYGAIMSEYGQESRTTIPVLQEYGKTICSSDAIEHIVTHFK